MNPASQYDSGLVVCVVEGDAEAFGDLYQRYLNQICMYVCSPVGEQYEAEDLTETAFLKDWEVLPRFGVEEVSFET